MGALSPKRAQQFQQRFDSWEDPSGVIPKFHYGTHYSSAASVLYYLLRLGMSSGVICHQPYHVT